ncbi:MAG TPA: IS110 family transposase [Pyrinomonadaceae bacterium]|nr:IS110 family transposase [Pyrinomonadaceae bacterium]
MNEKYVALDVHKSSIAVGVRDEEGNYITEATIQTKAVTLLEFVKGLSGEIYLTLEEGTQSAWLYDLLRPHVTACIVCDPRKNKLLEEGDKSDRIDVRKLSQLLYAGLLRPVYHGDHGTRALKELAHCYESLVRDRTRVKNRLKAIYRGRGICCEGQRVYNVKKRDQWLRQLSEPGVRQRAENLYLQLESLNEQVVRAQQQMLHECRKQRASALLRSVPTLGAISVAMIIATCDTPHRFRSKRQFWRYCGFAVVTRSSSDYYFEKGELRKRRKPALTRGLNRNYNRRLKRVFKSAATGATRNGPFKPFYERLRQRGLNADLAKLTLARKIAAVTLTVWKKGERFDPQKLK